MLSLLSSEAYHSQHTVSQLMMDGLMVSYDLIAFTDSAINKL